jgi:hypothetical protein
MSPAVEQIEIALLLEGVFRQGGYDFRSYASAKVRAWAWPPSTASCDRTTGSSASTASRGRA